MDDFLITFKRFLENFYTTLRSFVDDFYMTFGTESLNRDAVVSPGGGGGRKCKFLSKASVFYSKTNIFKSMMQVFARPVS